MQQFKPHWLLQGLIFLLLHSCAAQSLKPESDLGTPGTGEPPQHIVIEALKAPILAALLLKEVGYFNADAISAPKEAVIEALKSFQRDISLPQTGSLDPETWAKLQDINLSKTTRQQLKQEKIAPEAQAFWTEYMLKALNYSDSAAFQKHCYEPGSVLTEQQLFMALLYAFQNDGACQPIKTPYVETEPFPANIEDFKVKYPEKITPDKPLAIGDEVFAIEKLDCKGDGHQAWLLIYGGVLNEVANTEETTVQISERYAMWFDNRYEGVFDKSHLCAPRRRFCYTKINFSDWSGKLKAGEIEQFNASQVTSGQASILFAASQAIKKQCEF